MAKWEKLTKARESKGLNQSALSKAIDTGSGTISLWEKQKPYWAIVVERLCEVLGITPNALFGENDGSTVCTPSDLRLNLEECKLLQQVLLELNERLRNKLMHGKIMQEDVDLINAIDDLYAKVTLHMKPTALFFEDCDDII